MTDKTFEPVKLGPITLANHIVMAPMTRSRATGGVPNEMMATYYRQRAKAGLIVTEGTSPAPEGLGYARIPGLYNKEHVTGWRRVTDAVHEEGGHIFVQLMHTGRIFHELNLPTGRKGVAPSAIAAAGDMWTDQAQMQPNGTPQELSLGEVRRVRDEFVHSARLAMAAGFDGVELHGANGYLLEQFLNPTSNKRTDSYGGSVQNRARFVLEVTQGVANAIGADRTGIRQSPWSKAGDLAHYAEIDETYIYLVNELEKIGVVYLHLLDPTRYGPAGAETLAIIRREFASTLILNGGFHTLPAIENVLTSGRADLVAVGRPFISNPDFVERLRAGVPLVDPNPATFYSPGASGFAEGYTDYTSAA
ncbi:MAG TPA: alkene reductase [Gemmatimonadaceae bacterium]|nr:alkene reductase [Gemmatimonadaceae bacterium]